MKAAELILAMLAALCSLGSVVATYRKLPAAAAILGGLAVLICSTWILLRSA